MSGTDCLKRDVTVRREEKRDKRTIKQKTEKEKKETEKETETAIEKEKGSEKELFGTLVEKPWSVGSCNDVVFCFRCSLPYLAVENAHRVAKMAASRQEAKSGNKTSAKDRTETDTRVTYRKCGKNKNSQGGSTEQAQRDGRDNRSRNSCGARGPR